MSWLTFGVLSSLALVHLVASFKKPDYVETCSRNDPNLNACALKNGKKVIPHIINGDSRLKVPVLDPLEIEKLELVPAGNTRSVGLVIKCNQCRLIGLKDIQLTSLKFDLNARRIEVDAVIPQITLEGNYETTGRFLVLPVNGKGPGSLLASNNKVKIFLDYELVKRKNRDHAQIKTYKVDYSTTKLNIQLQNIFSGDRFLSENLNKFLNDNWRDVLKDLNPTISETIGEIIKTIVNQVFMQIPYNEVFPDT